MKPCHTIALAMFVFILLGGGHAFAENQPEGDRADDPPAAQHRGGEESRKENREDRREVAFKTSKEAYEATRDAYRALVQAISAANDARLAARTQEGRDAWADST